MTDSNIHLTTEQQIQLIESGVLAPRPRQRKSIPTHNDIIQKHKQQQLMDHKHKLIKPQQRKKHAVVYGKNGKRLNGKQRKAYLKRQSILQAKFNNKLIQQQQQSNNPPIISRTDRNILIVQKTFGIDNIISHLRHILSELIEFPEYEPDERITDTSYRIQCQLSSMYVPEINNIEHFNLLSIIDIHEYAHELNDDKLVARVADKPPRYEKITECKLRVPKHMYYKQQSRNNKRNRDERNDDIIEKCNCISDTKSNISPNKLQLNKSNFVHKSYNCNSMLCTNAALYMECTNESCNVSAELCQNRVITNKQWKNVEPFKTELKGWGLRACESISRGEFIIEYLGEVINNQMCIERITAQNDRIDQLTERYNDKHDKLIDAEIDRLYSLGHRRIQRSSIRVYCDKPAVAAYYYLTLDDDIILDANKYGTDARYLNHSCEPNCCVQKWLVDTHLCAAVYAVKDIECGEELCIDYKYDRIGDLERQRCYCGESTCSKYIGGEKSYIVDKVNEKRKSKKPIKKSAKKLHINDYDHECSVCGDGGDVILCEGKICGEFCTKVYHIECVNMTHVPNYTWLCPRHCCDGCGAKPPSIFCSGPVCRDSWCSACIDTAKLDIELNLIDDIDENLRMIELGRHERFVLCSDCQADRVESQQLLRDQQLATELAEQKLQSEREQQLLQQQELIKQRYQQLMNTITSGDININDCNYRHVKFDHCVAELGSLPLFHSKGKRGTRESIDQLRSMIFSDRYGSFRSWDKLQQLYPQFFIQRLHAINNKFYHRIDHQLDFTFPTNTYIAQLAFELHCNVDVLRNALIQCLAPEFIVPTAQKSTQSYILVAKSVDDYERSDVKLDNIITGSRTRKCSTVSDTNNIHSNNKSPIHKKRNY